MDFHGGEFSVGVLLAFVFTGYFALLGGVAELLTNALLLPRR
jgi:hypothetical protein